MFIRINGWERRLAGVIEAAQHVPYVLGTHDCFRVACRAVEALTGVDLWEEWAGQYRTRGEAIALLRHYAARGGYRPPHPNPLPACAGRGSPDVTTLSPTGRGQGEGQSVFTFAFSRLFGHDPEPMTRARRGDICEYFDREPHLGVCQGATVAVLGEFGLKHVPRSACSHCWLIG